MNRSVLIVEDEILISDVLALMVQDIGLSVCAAAVTADDAIRLAKLHRPSLVLMDVRLKGEKDGVDAALVIWPLLHVPIIYITGSAEPRNVARIQSAHPAGLIFKPFHFVQLKAAIERALGSAPQPGTGAAP